MKVSKHKVADLTHDPANARKHSERNLEAIKASLRRFGQQKPIVVTKDGMVIAGNGTLQAAMALGWTDIECAVTDLDGFERTAFGIADNRTAELAEWDDDTLGSLLEALGSEGVDLGDVGFTGAELDAMLNVKHPEADFPDRPMGDKPPVECPECGHEWVPE